MSSPKDSIATLLLLLFLATGAPLLAFGLQCYQCNSNKVNEGDCADPFLNERKYLKECAPLNVEANSMEPANNKVPTLCRKVRQYVRGEASVIRACATEEYKNECYKTVSQEYNTLSCTCKGDGCNGAANAAASLVATAAVALLAVALK